MSIARKSILKRSGLYHLSVMLLIFFISALTAKVNAQNRKSPANDSGNKQVTDTVALSKKNTANTSDTVLAARNRLADSLGIRISPDALPSPVTATATDSAVLDMSQNLFYLYGDAEVKYEDLNLKADQVTYSQSENTIAAEPVGNTDSTLADSVKRPSFQQGSETFTYDYLKYNFKSKRAIVRNARSQYGEGYVRSEQVKRNADNSIFGLKNDYTTCSLDTPHFSIRARRIKIIPGHIIIAGAANLMIEGVPTPIFLPFGVFPITESQRSGFRIPSYTLEEQRGLGLTNGGYYFSISEYADLLLLGSVFTKGSYNLSAVSTYADRYHYNGGLSINYAYNKLGEIYEPGATIQKQFAIQWRHATDAKARPGQSFNASVNIQKGNYYTDNSYNPNQITQNQFSSNISYQKSWAGKPFSLAISALFNQNTTNHIADLTLPSISFYVSQLTPFANKNRVGTAKWYEKISVSYSFTTLAQTSFYDTAFNLNKLGLNDFKTGFHHSIPVSAAYTVLKYLNLSFNVNYNEYWLTDQLYEYYNPSANKVDSISNRGFYTARDYNASASLSTRIYGIKRWSKGKIAGIRHVLTPNLGLTYTPDFARAPYNYAYQAYLSPNGNIQYYSPYINSLVGVPGLGQYGKFASNVNFGLNNNLQVKTRSGSDTGATTKNITLIDALSFASAYNLAADSFGWSNFALGFRTNILDKISVNGSATFSPYEYDGNLGRWVNNLTWDNGGFLNFQNASVALSSNFRSKERSSNSSKVPKSDEVSRLTQPGGYNDYIDFKVPWSLNVAYSLSMNKQYRMFINGGDTLTFNHSVLFSGDFNLTAHWKVTYSSGYSFTTKSLSLTSIDIYRDLHCFEMRLGTIPFGPRKSYNFTLNVKASALQDLKILRRRDFRDAAYY